MEIHPPLGRAATLREFFTHILIVTIGILIALGLEGVREVWREHSAIKDARDRFRVELAFDRDHMRLDQENVRAVDGQMTQLLTEMPALAKTPAELEKRVRALTPKFYFFSENAWETAIASGVLTHMKGEELDPFVEAYVGIKTYEEISRNTLPEWVAVEAFFQSHHSFTPADETEGEQRLRTLQMGLQLMEHVGQETSMGIDDALGVRNGRTHLAPAPPQ